MSVKWLLPAVLTGLMIGSVARPDVLTLKDGRVIQGSFYRQGRHYVIEPAGAPAFQVPLDALVGVELKTAKNSPQYAAQQWAYLQSQIAHEQQLPAIIAALQSYLKTYPHAKPRGQVRQALARYKRYQAAGWVWFAGRWMSAPARVSLRIQRRRLTNAALGSLRAGQLIVAGRQVSRALALDPGYQPGWIVQGVVEYRLGQLAKAAASFHKCLVLGPHNVLGWNDLAIVYYHERLQPAALACYAQALPLAGGNRRLLDNIYVALHGYRGSRRAELYRKLARAFTLADRQMQAKLAAQGLYRFGATWVSGKKHARLLHALQLYRKEKDSLQAQYDADRVALESVTADLRQVNAELAALNNGIGLYGIGPSPVFFEPENIVVAPGGDPPPAPSQQPLGNQFGGPGVNPQAPGQNPSQPGVNPQAPGQNPRQPGRNPQSPGVNPRMPGINPQINVPGGASPPPLFAPTAPGLAGLGPEPLHRHRRHHHRRRVLPGFGWFGFGGLNFDATWLAQVQAQQLQLQTERIQLQAAMARLRVEAARLAGLAPVEAGRGVQRMMLPVIYTRRTPH